MGRLIDEAILQLEECKAYKQCDTEKDLNAFDVAITTMRKYQQLQADYENRLKADMVAMLEDLKQDLIAEANGIAMDCTVFVVKVADIDKVIQQKINELKAESEDKE